MLSPDSTVMKKEQVIEGNLQWMTWQEYSAQKMDVLKGVIEEIVKNKGRVPDQLFQIACTLSKMTLALSSLKSYKEDVGNILGVVLGLVVVLYQSYKKHQQMYEKLHWPPPKLEAPVNELVATGYSIHKLMRRNSKNFSKRVLVGDFGIGDLGKIKRYQWTLDLAAYNLEKTPHNFVIYDVLVEAVNSRAQPQNQIGSELSVEPLEVDSFSPSSSSPLKGVARERSTDKGPTADSSFLREVEKSTIANQRIKSEDAEKDEQTESKAWGKKKAKDQAKDDSEDEGVEKRSPNGKPVNMKRGTRRLQEGVVAQLELKETEGNKARHTKFNEEAIRREGDCKGKRRRYEEPEDGDLQEGNSRDINDPANGPSRKKPVTIVNRRSQTIPVSLQTLVSAQPRSQATIPGLSFYNGNGVMINHNVGNIHNSTVSDVGDGLKITFLNASNARDQR